MNTTAHIPVLVSEVIAGLNLKPGDNVIDATLGGGGHAQAILEATAPNGKLLGIDWDPKAIELAKQKLQKCQPKADGPLAHKDRLILKTGNYREVERLIYGTGLNEISAILLDLGLSTDQLADQSRGFSFISSGPLDMRFSDQELTTAAAIVNTWSEKDLAHIFRKYGEERHATRIARLIVANRQRAPFNSALELADVVLRGAGRRGSKKRISARGGSAFGRHPATRVFQALRITINRELENLEAALPDMVALLKSGGRLAVISFHSLEDRIVKQFFKRESRGCLCPSELPECRCNHQASLRLINKKVITPTPDEIQRNPASRSAKLRIAEKL